MNIQIVEEIYGMEQLLPLVTMLSEKYTSKESTSISYETARMLMEAVLYTMGESLKNKAALTGEPPLPELLYEEGYQIILSKAKEAVKLYEQLMLHFEDYGCLNYRDTIVHGMPAFFLRYDARFRPMDHLLTLDYPLMCHRQDISGVDLILYYLKCIELEARFLSAFSVSSIRKVLERQHSSYESLYLDNICEPVLFTVLLCGIAGCPITDLEIGENELKRAAASFRGYTLDLAQEKIQNILNKMFASDTEFNQYFSKSARDFAVRIRNLPSFTS